MTCIYFKPVYAPQVQGGLNLASSQNDGYQIALQWDKAYPSTLGNQIAYNIYFSLDRNDIIEEGAKFVALSGQNACLNDFSPGKKYYFVVRATEYNPDWYDLSDLPNSSQDNLKIYPESLLLSDISKSSTSIPISDLDAWPSQGVAQIGVELVKYSSKDSGTSSLVVEERGFLDTDIRLHQTDGYDGYQTQDPIIRFFKGFEDDNLRVQAETSTFFEPNYAFTHEDGYATNSDKLNVDFSTQDEERVDFPEYDEVGWHRTDPRSIVLGKCIGTYIGGEQFCADGYRGVGRRIRGIPLNEQALRREEQLLRTTGHAVVLVKRMWGGVRCPCVTMTGEQPQLKCHKCFVPGTLVRTEHGYRPIEKVKEGDKVLTKSGKYHRVTNVMKNRYDGYLSSILPSISTSPIRSTPEHPFLTLGGSHQNSIQRNCGPKCNTFIQNGDGVFNHPLDVRQLPSGLWHARVTCDKKRTILGSFERKDEAISVINKFKKENLPKGHQLVWKDAQELKENDWLVSGWNRDVVDVNYIKVPKKYQKQTTLGLKRNGVNEFKVDDRFLWIIGIYLAEGSCGSRSINFALNKKEKVYKNEIIEYFKSLGYGTSVKNKKDNEGCVVSVFSTTLSKWFKNWLGQYCDKKTIPEILMKLPPKKQIHIIHGIWDGDGSKTIEEFEITQTSKILTLQIAEILHRNNKQPLIRSFESNFLTPKGNKRKRVFTISWEKDNFHHNNRKSRWSFEDEALAKIRETSTEYYSGYVYNLEVEVDHTYVVEGVVVHNCYGTGFLTGYQQYPNPRRSDGRILVRPGEYPDNLKHYEPGLESEAILDLWTLPVPAIKQWDFIIRYNKDGTEEFRYEVIDVTRNTLFNEEYGVQKFRAQRIRKTSPIYAWKAIADTSTIPEKITTSIGMMAGPNGTQVPHTHEITINENITSTSQIDGTTSVSAGHSHVVKNGVVQDQVGHSHIITLT